jgi:hypothetical protein
VHRMGLRSELGCKLIALILSLNVYTLRTNDRHAEIQQYQFNADMSIEANIPHLLRNHMFILILVRGCARSLVVQDTHCAWERVSSDQKIPHSPGETLT